MSIAVLSLGSNLGDREEHISKALLLLSERVGVLLAVSKPYFSAPQGFQSPHEFCNVCAKIATTLDPHELLRITQAIELELGRIKKEKGRILDRIIDIDIVFYDDLVLETDELILPHPRWNERLFVVEPLKEIQ